MNSLKMQQRGDQILSSGTAGRKIFGTLICLCLGLLISGGSIDLRAQESSGSKSKPRVRRLPNDYNNLKLTDQQKTDVYAIQDKADEEIEKLEEKIREIKRKEQADLEAVLTAEQKQLLSNLRAVSKSKKSTEKSGSDKSTAPEEKSPTSKKAS